MKPSVRNLSRGAALMVCGSVAVLNIACGTADIRAQGQVDVRAIRIATIFDPTILTIDKRVEVDKLLERLAVAFGSGPTKKTVDVWSLGDSMMQHPAVQFEKQSQLDVHKVQQDAGQISGWFRTEVKPALMLAWTDAHTGKNSRAPATCLLTGLYCLSGKLRTLPVSEGVVAIIMSDLLEVCNDWDAVVNMEERVDANELRVHKNGIATEDAKRLIDLSKLSRIIVVHVASAHVRRPAQLSEVESIWLRTLRDLKAPKDVRFYLEIPSVQDLFEPASAPK